MNDWQPTIGKWNDPDEYYMSEPLWRRTLRFAKEYHTQAGSYIVVTDKDDLRLTRRMPYIDFVKAAMVILTDEAHYSDDLVLEHAALYGLLEHTSCTLSQIEEQCGEYVAEGVCLLAQRPDEDFAGHLMRLIAEDSRSYLPCVLLAFWLQELRLIRCPFDTWVEDKAYYDKLEQALDTAIDRHPDGSARFLIEKIKEQLDYNRTISLNHNKTSEELFAGWNED